MTLASWLVAFSFIFKMWSLDYSQLLASADSGLGERSYLWRVSRLADSSVDGKTV